MKLEEAKAVLVEYKNWTCKFNDLSQAIDTLLEAATITDEMVERAGRGIAFIGGMVGDLDEETGNHLMVEITNDNCHQMAKAALTAAREQSV
jgi:DNA polymerase II small subunit/DNA polymerase delta subunit B